MTETTQPNQLIDLTEKVSKLPDLDGDQALHLLITYGPVLGVVIGLFVSLLVLKGLLLKLLTRKARQDEQLAGWRFWVIPFIQKISGLLLFAFALTAGLRMMPVTGEIGHIAGSVLSVAIFIQVGLIASTVLKLRTEQLMTGSRNKTHDAAQATVFSTLSLIGQMAIWVVVLLLSLENIGIDVTTLIAGVGIGGIAIAFAFKSILEDVFASLSIAIDKPFVIGDSIISGEHMGTVEKIGMKNIRIRSISGEQIIINNNDILASRVRNYGRMFERRVLFTLKIEYGTPAEKLRQIPEMIKGIIEAQPYTRFDRSHFKEYADFSLNFENVYYVTIPDYKIMMDTQQTINLAIYEAFEQNNIAFGLSAGKNIYSVNK